MNRNPQVKSLQSAPAGITITELITHSGDYVVIAPDALSDQIGLSLFQCGADALAARNLANTHMPRTVFHDEDIAGEERAMRSAQIEEHAIGPGDRYDSDVLDSRRTRS